ncbi:MAG: M23 family metallopeptidase [Acidobacteria bacterium]|nr:M23 family metallopeptidase [Acidobacteriota bacterium]MYG75227.1 M23 family metallopeptidase [Acidobacteriota bacterium]
MFQGCRGQGATEPVRAPRVRFDLPVGGVPGRDWVINNYVDRDQGPGVRDYRGGRRSYNRHQGTDWDVPNFRWMDRGFPVLAAANGRVTATHDGEFDRNVSCGFLGILQPPNLVELTHPDGTRSRYVHLRRGSVRVAVGQRVAAGEALGEIGSSGCSTAPHLHFEVRGPDGAILDPFQPNLWTDPPPYENALTVMDLVVRNGPIESEDILKDPPPNAQRISPDQTLGIGLSLAGGFPGDQIEVLLEGAVQPEILAVMPGEPPHTYPFWNLPPDRHRGTRRIVVRTGRKVLASHELR